MMRILAGAAPRPSYSNHAAVAAAESQMRSSLCYVSSSVRTARISSARQRNCLRGPSPTSTRTPSCSSRRRALSTDGRLAPSRASATLVARTGCSKDHCRRGTDELSRTGSARARPARGAAAGLLVNEAFQVGEQCGELVGWRWYVRRGLDGCASRSDPVLRRPELPWLPIAAAHAGENHCVHLPNEADTHWQRGEPLETGFDGTHVVHDLLDVGSEVEARGFGVEDPN
jgi:hypothetical protein